ncbi:MAG TPA: ATP-binding protein [Solirubrobacteraceae bacterium]|nr:ATP-binding protein [Solirubrobacteraceae bacterium]
MLVLSAAVAVALGATLVVLIIAVTGQRDAGRIAFSSQKALTLTTRLESSLFEIEKGVDDYVRDPRHKSPRSVQQRLDGYAGEVRELSEQLSDDPGQRARVSDIEEKILDYVLQVQALMDFARDDDEFARGQLAVQDRPNLAVGLAKDLRRLGDRERALVSMRESAAESQSARAITIGKGGLGLVFVVVVVGTWYLRHVVVRPVLNVAGATGRLAAGDLSTRVPEDREDEIGDLARGFNSMADSLQRGQAELERSNAELLRSNAELEQFASVTSHDLQAPLTTISMYAELLERRHPREPGAGHDLIDGIRGATHQARMLIRDLLEYSRAGRGELTVEPLPVDLVVSQALEALAGSIESTGARVRVGSLPTVLADRSNLCRVFQNLVGNAVKFTRGDDPEVSVAAERDGEMWRFEVRDNGIGMDPANSRRIFEPFRRLHGEEDYPGTGIGLAVCERIVEQHGGRIWVSSTPGEGSVFSFTMPATQPPPADDPAHVDQPVTAGQH